MILTSTWILSATCILDQPTMRKAAPKGGIDFFYELLRFKEKLLTFNFVAI